MAKEVDALLLKNNMWPSVSHFCASNVIGCKWMFRIKRNPGGTIARYKAHLVAKGFRQHPNLDYAKTFSSLIKATTMKLLSTFVMSHS